MNNLRRRCLGILAVLITVTLSACSEGQGKSHKQREQARRSEPRVSGGESGGKPVEAPKAKPRIVPKKKIVEDEVKVYFCRSFILYAVPAVGAVDTLTTFTGTSALCR
jgi:hypothetical protein